MLHKQGRGAAHVKIVEEEGDVFGSGRRNVGEGDGPGRFRGGGRGGLAIRTQFGECGDSLGRPIIEDLEIRCVEAADGAAVCVSNRESGLDQVGFGAQDHRGRRIRVCADDDFARRSLRR